MKQILLSEFDWPQWGREETVWIRHAAEVKCIEHGLHISSGDIVVWLTEDAAERLNLDGNAYEITGDGSVSWQDRDYGDQYSENGAGGDTEENARNHMFANPEAGMGEIENSMEFGSLSQLREEA